MARPMVWYGYFERDRIMLVKIYTGTKNEENNDYTSVSSSGSEMFRILGR